MWLARDSSGREEAGGSYDSERAGAEKRCSTRGVGVVFGASVNDCDGSPGPAAPGLRRLPRPPLRPRRRFFLRLSLVSDAGLAAAAVSGPDDSSFVDISNSSGISPCASG